MKKYQKGISATALIILVAVILIVICGAYFWSARIVDQNTANENPNIPHITSVPGLSTSSPMPIKKTNTVNISCGFAVISPAANSAVNFPLTITGTVNNSNKQNPDCNWSMFEGQAGTAQLYYNYQNQGWKALGVATPVKAANWTSDVSPFAVTMNFKNDGIGLPSGTPMKVVFVPENPSGMPNNKSFELQIAYKNSDFMTYSGKTDSGTSFTLTYPSSWTYYKYSCDNNGVAFWPKSVAPDVTKDLGCDSNSPFNTAPIFVNFTSKGPQFAPLNGSQYKAVYDQMKGSLVY